MCCVLQVDTISHIKKSLEVDMEVFTESAWQAMCNMPLAPTLSLMPQQQLMALKAQFNATVTVALTAAQAPDGQITDQLVTQFVVAQS